MPLYEYRCRECGAEFEELVSLHTTEPPACPSCSSSDKTEKMMSMFGSLGGTSGGSSCGPSGFS